MVIEKIIKRVIILFFFYIINCIVKTNVTVLSSFPQLRKCITLSYVHFVSIVFFLKKKIDEFVFLKKKQRRKKNTKPWTVCQTKTLIQTVRVFFHLHGLIFELKERMNSRQDRPVILCVLFFFKKKIISKTHDIVFSLTTKKYKEKT